MKPVCRVFVCSPLRATYQFSFDQNVALAKRLCLAACRAGFAPFAPHLFYPLFLDDMRDSDRDLGIKCGMAWMGMCDEVWVYADHLDMCSEGMKAELERAEKYAIPPKVRFMPTEWATVEPRVATRG